jgi:hypothetical protein
MKTIPLTQGQHAIVDDEDYPELSQFKWCAHRNGNTFYAVRTEWTDGKDRSIMMHRQIVGLGHGDKREVDHRSGDGLNNQTSNLRIATHQQNQHNQRLQRRTASGYKGVCWVKRDKKWRADIAINSKPKWLGLFNTAAEAAHAYDKAALELHGEFACLNFPPAKAA